MLRDIEAGAAIEADHVVGDLLTRGGVHALLRIVYASLKTYEAKRSRLLATAEQRNEFNLR